MKRRHARKVSLGTVALAGLLALCAGPSPVQAGDSGAKLASAVFPKGSSNGKSGKWATVVTPTTTAPATTTTTTAAPATTTAPTTSQAPVTTTSTTAPPPTTTAPPTTTSPPVSGGSSMPVGDLPGWRQVFTDDFNTSVPVGGFAAVYGSRWAIYGDGWKDTAAQSEGTASRYFPSRVLSVQDGMLNKYLHTENGITMVAAVAPKIGDQLYGRYAVRFRADEVAGFKTAWLLWPQSGAWPGDGEIDFPEGNLDGNIWAFTHRQGATSGSDQDAFATSARYGSWHTAVFEWKPGSVTFILDGRVIGTSTNRVPNTPMHWVLQTETCLGNCQPSSTAEANVQIDWVAAYAYNP